MKAIVGLNYQAIRFGVFLIDIRETVEWFVYEAFTLTSLGTNFSNEK